MSFFPEKSAIEAVLKRLQQISEENLLGIEQAKLIEYFRPDAIVDFVLTACHSYNIESYKVGRHVTEQHGLPSLKIESNYSDNDEGQIRMKIEALFEIVAK